MRASAARARSSGAAVLLALLATAGGCGSPPDTDPRAELEPLYERLYDEAEERFGRDLRTSPDEADRLARSRLVNAANALADEAARTSRTEYEIELPHLNVPEEPPPLDVPVDFEITLTAEELGELGVPVGPGAGGSETESSEGNDAEG